MTQAMLHRQVQAIEDFDIKSYVKVARLRQKHGRCATKGQDPFCGQSATSGELAWGDDSKKGSRKHMPVQNLSKATNLRASPTLQVTTATTAHGSSNWLTSGGISRGREHGIYAT